VKQERTHYHGHFGVYFSVTRFTVMPEDRLALRSLHFCDAGCDYWRVHDFITETYDRMLAQKRPCERVVAVSRPLTRDQAQLFNDQNDALALATAGIIGKAFPVLKPWQRKATGAASGFSLKFALDTRHAGDVIVAVQAWVEGGIGQQHSSRTMLIKNKGGAQ
jgi:hypothetical protein